MSVRTVTDEHTYAAQDVVELVADGDVTVHPGGPGVDVATTGRYAFSAPHYTAAATDSRLVVSYRCTWAWLPSCTTKLDVTLPADTQVVVRTSNGDVRASGLAAALDLHTSNGSIETWLMAYS